ncbi:MAG TPA: hypothetical protein VFR36_05550 [Sphingomicrobium sp.]|nr:hypothetical protein [Sphingomicrobium sp.]
MTGSIFDADAHCWSGLLSGRKFAWQKGLREVSLGIGGVQFHPSHEDLSGYQDWRKVADAAIARKAEGLLLIGHSNGVYAITAVAEYLAQKNSPIKCVLAGFDQTKKPCPYMGKNVVAAIEIWAGLNRMKMGDDFAGAFETHPEFRPDSHIGVISNPKAQRLVVDFALRWKHVWGRP